MGTYVVELSSKEEEFLDLYLNTYQLREEHTRNDYPGLIAHNFIQSMMKREKEIKKVYKAKNGKAYRRKQHGSQLD